MTGKTIMTKAISRLCAGMALALVVATVSPVAPAAAATVPIDLYAVTGATTLGTQTVNVWGYTSTGAAATQPGGPTVIVNAGDTVQVTLHNQLTESTALLFQGQDVVPDRTGAAAGTTKQYTFVAGRPGTYLYEAGLVANAQHQVAMGLYGALIVRPATAGQAYAAPATAFDDEAVLVLSEIDPVLNNALSPAAFDMRKYAPRYFLINGKAYPNTDPIPTVAGHKVLLRYLNAGNQYHSMAALGAHQAVIALDGNPLTHPRQYVADTFGPGQTADALVTAPATTADATLAIFDGSLLLHNSNAPGYGGALTFLNVAGSGGGSDTVGPAANSAAYASGTLTATLDEATTGGATVSAAEYYLDSVAGAAVPMSAADGAFNAVSEVATAAMAIPSGQHVLYVRGQDSLGSWGALTSVLVNGADTGGPTTSFPTLAPSRTNGAATAPFALHATADDTASGGSNIVAAEYFLDVLGADGSGSPMTVNVAAPVASVDAMIAAATVNALAEGTHPAYVHAMDAGNNWGAAVPVSLVVDKTAPSTAGVSVAPSPNNGTLAYNSAIPAVRVSAATLTDPLASGVNSPISAGEVFLDTVGASGSGIPLVALDGVYDSPVETGYADIPLATVSALANGNHLISVHAKDAAGNWGALSTATLLIDKVKPTVTGVTATPNPTQGAGSVTVSATANDAATAITRAEWFTGVDPGAGNGTALTVAGTGPWSLSGSINVSSWSEGSYPLSVRARDAAGNWSASVSTVLRVQGPLYFSTVGSSNPPGVGGAADDADIYHWTGATYSRAWDATAFGLPGGANVDGYDRVDATHFYLSFSGATTTVPGLGAVQDEDVVYYNNGVWQLYFNGTAHGLTSNNLDLDAISIVGGTLYFSTVGNTNPPGVGGAADNADIYSWNGTSYARVWDASASGLPAAANVDGFVRVDATHFYLSFSADTTVPGLGVVQDEDVIYHNAGTWSVYFNGTAHGLTSNNLDIDAFDLG